MNCSFFMPTHVFFGENCVLKNGHELRRFGKTALIITGNRSASACGALDDVVDVLKTNSVSFEIYNGIRPNPSIENVRDAVVQAKKINAEFVIGIGGGSPMDAAKAVAMLAVQDFDDESLFSGPYQKEPLPVIAIPTTSGTGSEVTPYSILTDNRNKTKKNLYHPSLFPRIALLDPRYTMALSYEVTLNTAFDALSHSVESALSRKASSASVAVAIESLKALGPCLLKMNADDPVDFETREKLMCGSMLAGAAIAQTGTTVVHAMGYCLTYFKGLDHGKANGLLLSGYLRYVQPENQYMVSRIVSALGLEDFEELLSLIENHMPVRHLLSREDVELFSNKAVHAKSTGNTRPTPEIEDIIEIYRKSLCME